MQTTGSSHRWHTDAGSSVTRVCAEPTNLCNPAREEDGFAETAGRCFRAVDSMSDEEPKLIAIDEETNDQIVHRRRFGKAHRATHETLDPGPHIDVFALDFLRVLLANVMLL